MNRNSILLIILAAVLFAGRTVYESTEPTATQSPTSTPISTPTGHELAGEQGGW